MVFAVIVCTNEEDEIVSLIPELRQQGVENVVVVDNASQEFSRVKDEADYFIRNKKNLLFSRAANKGIRLALDKSASHVLFMNPDVEVGDKFLSALLRAKYDIAGPVIRYARDERIWSAGGRVDFEHRKIHHINKRRRIDPRVPDWITFCCALVKREVFEEIGLFDEDYRFYGEDVDFCWRARNAGMTVGIVRESLIYHKIPTYRFGLKRLYHMNRSERIFFQKHAP